MSLHGKVVIYVLAGALASVLTGALMAREPRLFSLHGVLLGLLMGVLLGLTEAVSADAVPQKRAALILGSLCGAGGGALGQTLQPHITHLVTHSRGAHALVTAAQSFLALLGAASLWSVIGLCLGAGLGGARGSWRLAWQCALGGLSGGLLGGLVLSASYDVLRANAPLAAGALTGLGLGSAPLLFNPARIRVLRGGEEQILVRTAMLLGQDETCDLTLRGDSSIAPLHAVIERIPGHKRYRLRALTGGADGYSTIMINGRPMLGEQWLADGDRIQIGSFLLAYRDWATRGALRLGPPQPQVWTKVTGAWQMTALASTTPSPKVVVPTPPQDAPPERPSAASPVVAVVEETPLLGLSRDATPLLLPPIARPLGDSATRDGGMMLHGMAGPYAGQDFWVGCRTVTIGRALERDIALPMDTAISRLHARVLFEQGQHIIADAGAANGTLLNGQTLLAPRPLHPGDLIILGATTLRCGERLPGSERRE